jgi:hypothetical protein
VKDVAATFQAATVDKLGGVTVVLDWAVAEGGGAVELPKEYPDLLTTPQIAAYDAAIEAAGRGVGRLRDDVVSRSLAVRRRRRVASRPSEGVTWRLR